MARRIIDLSVPLQNDVPSDPPDLLPKLTYLDHHATAPSIAKMMGIAVDQLPDGEYAAVELRRIIFFPAWIML